MKTPNDTIKYDEAGLQEKIEQLEKSVLELGNLVGLQKKVIARQYRYMNDSDSQYRDLITHLVRKGFPMIPEVMFALVSSGPHGKIFVMSPKLENILDTSKISVYERPWPELVDRQTLGELKYKRIITHLMVPEMQEGILPIYLNENVRWFYFFKQPVIEKGVHVGSGLILDTDLGFRKAGECEITGLEEREAQEIFEIFRRKYTPKPRNIQLSS